MSNSDAAASKCVEEEKKLDLSTSVSCALSVSPEMNCPIELKLVTLPCENPTTTQIREIFAPFGLVQYVWPRGTVRL